MICAIWPTEVQNNDRSTPEKWRLIQIKVDADQSAPCEEQNIKDAVR
jgi:hypothetical protein